MTSDLASLSLEALKALVAEKQADEKKAVDTRNQEIVTLGAPVWNRIIAVVPRKQTESTGRVGHDMMTASFTGEDGIEYTVSVHVTDVKATEKGRADAKRAKEAKEAAEKAQAAAAAYASVSLEKTP